MVVVLMVVVVLVVVLLFVNVLVLVVMYLGLEDELVSVCVVGEVVGWQFGMLFIFDNGQ